MAWVSLRRFAWTTKINARGIPEVDSINPIFARRRLPVDISDVIMTNALATNVNRATLYSATLHELRLLGSYLHNMPGQQVRLRDTEFRASSRHICSFVSESVGLGMLTATVQAAYRWYAAGGVHNLDALPISLAGLYARRGARPDLLFDTPAVRLAGESRGRSRPPGSSLREHRARLNQLLPWAQHHGHPLVMTWTHLTGRGLIVDWFEPHTGLPNLTNQIGEPLPFADSGRPARAGTIGDHWAQGDSMFDEEAGDSTASELPDSDLTSSSEVLARARQRKAQIEDDLFLTAPETDRPIHVAGQSLRGTWLPLDLVGPSTGSLLLAIFDQAPQHAPEVVDLIRQRISLRAASASEQKQTETGPDEPPVTVTVRDRLLVAVAGRGLDRPWDWFVDGAD